MAENDPKNQPVLGQPLPRIDLNFDPIPQATGVSFKDRDYGIPNIGTDTQYIKGQMQSGWQQAGRATVGLLTGALGAAENIVNLTEVADGVQGAVENELGKFLREQKQALNEEFSIYKSEEGIALDDTATYYEGLKSILDSATAFGISGGIVGRTVGMAGKALHATRLARMAKITEPLMNSATRTTGALINNYIEGTTMAVSLYEDIERDMQSRYPNMDKNEIKKVAAKKAEQFRLANGFLIGSDLVQMGKLANAFEFTRGFEKRNIAKEIFKQAGSEFAQEGAQSLGQETFRQSAVEQRDMDIRMLLDNTFRAETLYEAVIGAVAGPMQFGAMTAIGRLGEQGKKKEAAYQKNLETYENAGKYIAESLENTQKFEDELKKQRVSEDDLKKYAESHISILAAKAFRTGTADQFERQIDSLIEEEKEKDKPDKARLDYLNSFKKQFQTLEKEYIAATVYVNPEQVFQNRGHRTLLDIQKKALDEKLAESKKQIESSFSKYGITGYEAKFNPETNEFEIFVKDTDTKVDVNLTGKKPSKKPKTPVNAKVNQQAKAKVETELTEEEQQALADNLSMSRKEEKAALEAFYSENEDLFRRLAYITKSIQKVDGFLKENNDEYKEITSEKGQKAYLANIEEIKVKIEAEEEKERQKESQKSDADEVDTTAPVSATPKEGEGSSASDLERAAAAGIEIKESEPNALPDIVPVIPPDKSEPNTAVEEPIKEGEGSSAEKLSNITQPESKPGVKPELAQIVRETGKVTKLETVSDIENVIFSIANFSVLYDLVDSNDPAIKILVDKQQAPTSDYRLDKKNLKDGTKLTLKYNADKDGVEIYATNSNGDLVLIGALHTKEFIDKGLYEVIPDIINDKNDALKRLELIKEYVKSVGSVETTISNNKTNSKRKGISVTDKNGKYFITSKAGFFKVITVVTPGKTFLIDGIDASKQDVARLFADNKQELDNILALGSGEVFLAGEDGEKITYTASTVKEAEEAGNQEISDLLDNIVAKFFSPTNRFSLKELNLDLLSSFFLTKSGKITDKDPDGSIQVDYADKSINIKIDGKVIRLVMNVDYQNYKDQIKSVVRTNQKNLSDAKIFALVKKFEIPGINTAEDVKRLRTSTVTSNVLIKSYTDINGVQRRSSLVNPVITIDYNELEKQVIAHKNRVEEVEKQQPKTEESPVSVISPVIVSKSEYSTDVASPFDEDENLSMTVKKEEEESVPEDKLSDISIEGVSEGTLLSIVKAVSKRIVDSAKAENERKKNKDLTEEEKEEQRKFDKATVNNKLDSFFNTYISLYTDKAINSPTEKEKEYYSAVLNELIAAKNEIGIVKMRLKAYLNYIKSGNEFTEDLDSEYAEQIEKNNDDDFLFKFDPKMSASNRLKSSLLFIQEYKQDGVPAKGLFGEIYVDPNVLWFKLRDVFSVLDSSATVEEYIEILRKNYHVHPEFKDIVNLLEKENVSYHNEFISQMNVHENVMIGVSFTTKVVTDPDTGLTETVYYINVNRTNDFDRARVFISAWKRAFRDKGLYYKDENDTWKFNAEKYKAYKERIKQYSLRDGKASTLSVKEMLTILKEELGITLPKSFTDLASSLELPDSRPIYFARRRVTNAAQILDVIDKLLVTPMATDPSNLVDNKLFGIAMYMSKFDSSIRTRNQRVGDKIFSGYILPNSITNKAKKFKRNSKEELGINSESMLKDIKGYVNDPFSQDSLWLEMLYGDLMGKEGLYDEAFKVDFNVNFLSENPLQKKPGKHKKATELGKISPTDLMFTQLSLFFANYNTLSDNIDTGVSTFVSPTIADVKSLYYATSKAFNLKKDIEKTGLEVLSDAQYKVLIRSLFLPEVKRAIAYERAEVKPDIAGFDKNAFRFFFVNKFNKLTYNGQPVLNEKTGLVHEAIKKIVENDATDLLSIPNDNLNLQQFSNDLKRVILESIEEVTKENTEFILKNGLDKDSKLANIANNPNQIFNFTANYMISNAEWFKLFLGDPALYGNKDGVTLEATLNDIGKRIKGQHSPGMSVPYRSDMDNRYNTLVIEDILTPDGDVATDSEEYISISEHVENLYHRGLISTEQYDNYKKIRQDYMSDLTLLLSELTEIDPKNYTSNEEYFLAVSKKLTPEIIEQVRALSNTFDIIALGIEQINPLKPVQHGDIYTEENNPAMSMVTKGIFYNKSSTKVLISSFTAPNKTLDNLRISLDILESSKVKKFTPNRLAAKSGVKLGKPVPYKRKGQSKPGYTSITQNPIDFIKELTGQQEYTPSMVTLNRNVLKYQQDFVDKENKKITPTSQGRSMFALDMALAKADKTKYEQIWDKLYKVRYENLKKRYTTNGKVDFKKIKELLIEHAETLNYTKAEIDFIKAGGDSELAMPLLSNPNYKRFQFLFTSLFTRGVIGDGISGDSQVLLSSAGLDEDNTKYFGDQTFSDIKSNIVYAEGWDGNLQDEREGAKGETLGAQVIVPLAFHYRNAAGERVKMKLSDITRITEDGKKVIDTSKLPEGVLESFGFRIPYQGHGSSAKLEIVGFLPEGVNGIIAPASFVAKMGGDYDFDKLNIYTFNLNKKEDGSFNYSNDLVDTLENDIIDAHINIRNNWKQLKEVERAIKYGNLYSEDDKEMPNTVFGVISALRQKSEKDMSIAFNTYQAMKYHNAKGAKSAIGIYANYMVLLGYMQDKAVEFDSSFSFSIGNTSNNKLNDLKVVGKNKFKSEVLAAFLSLSIDNEKLQAAGLLNINDFTINATAAAAFLGYDEDIMYMLNQKSITTIVEKAMLGVNTVDSDKEVNLTDAIRSTTQDLYKELEAVAPEKVVKTVVKGRTVYSLKGEIENKYSLQDYRNNLTDNSVITSPEAIAEKILMQIKAVELFAQLNDLGEKFQTLSSTLNTDSKGTPKTVLELADKNDKIKRIKAREVKEPILDPLYPISNYKQMFFNGVKASANLYGVEKAFNDIKQILELDPLLDVIEIIKGSVGNSYRYNSTEQFDLNSVLYKDFVSFLYASSIENAREERQRLLIDSSTNKSLTSTIQDIHSSPAYRKLLRDFPILNYIKVNEHSQFDVNFLENTENDQFTDDYVIKYASFNALYDANIEIKGIKPGQIYTTRDLYNDLVQYCLVVTGVQGSNDFFKYVNPKYLVNNNKGQVVKEILAKLSTDSSFASSFVEEFILHNPEVLRKVAWKAIGGEIRTKIEDLERLGYDYETNNPLYVKDNDNNVYKVDYSDIKNEQVRIRKMSRFEVFGVNEYNNAGKPSLFSKKKSDSVSKAAEIKAELSKTAKDTSISSNGIQSGTGKQGVVDYLNRLRLDPNTTKSQLVAINYILINKDLLPDNITIVIDSNLTYEGSANSATGIIKLKTDNNTNVNLEEIIHLVTAKAVMSDKVSDNTKAIREKLKAAHKAVIERLRKQDVNFDNKVKLINAKVQAAKQKRTDIDTALTLEEFLIYRLYDLQEFVAGIVLDKDFNEYAFGPLSKLSETEKKSILETIAEFIRSLLTDLGIDYTNEQHLSALNVVLELTESVKDKETIVKTEPVSGTERIDEKGQLLKYFKKGEGPDPDKAGWIIWKTKEELEGDNLSPLKLELDKEVVVNDIKFTDIEELGKYIKSLCL